MKELFIDLFELSLFHVLSFDDKNLIPRKHVHPIFDIDVIHPNT